MDVFTSLLVLLLLLIDPSVQQCTIEQFKTSVTTMVMSKEDTSAKQSIIVNSTYYNCLSLFDTSDHYSSMSVSILYIRSDDLNNLHEVRYNLQCNNSVWEIVGNQLTALRSNTSYNCSDCTDQTVNDYHCTSFRGCQLNQNNTWNITWPPTDVGRIVEQKCSGNRETNGFAYRYCLRNNSWGSVDVSKCQTVEILALESRAKELRDTDTVQKMNNRTSDIVETSSTETVLDIVMQLENITLASRPILPKDLCSIANILGIIQFVINKDINGNSNHQQILRVIQVIVQLLDCVLDEVNDVSFDVVKDMTNKRNLTVAEQFQAITEQTGILLSRTLPNNATDIAMDKFTYSNIIVLAQIPTEQGLMDKDSVEFSASLEGRMRASMRIPTVPIQNEMKKQGRRPPVINIISRNIHLPTQEGERIASLVLSGKISTDFENQTSLGDSQAVMSFSIENKDFVFNPRCSFFSYSSNGVASGRFSSDGVTLSRNNANNTFVQCSTTHLTSFAVLVDVSGENKPTEALSIVSYIGCTISIVCLLIAVCLLIVLSKKVFCQEQHFLHLNLSIALLFGLITFVSGIETASEYRTSCLIVAILLHYFFMAVFSWMLCEGILLFIMIKLVFYHGFLNSRAFFLLLGWGLPIPIVALSAAVSHEQYGYNDKCWISEENGAIWAFIGPMLLIIMINSLFLVVTIYEIYKADHKGLTAAQMNYKNTIKSLVRAAIIVVPLLGITWVVGILAVNKNTVVFAWIFTMLNSLQGMLILILYVLKNEKFLLLCRKKLTQNFQMSIASSKGVSVKGKEASMDHLGKILSMEKKSNTSDVICDNEAFNTVAN
ncbi:adhesion G protein-coupled receptor L3-like isoform X2 [Dysidea avara]|uniref:adhesion G protein-coupled receptor L3-like isoform X2 n=1 Tax=Dysidea avara TaxID=196820 RepID=UPI00332283D4